MNHERRVYQRLALTKPLPARFGRYKVRLLDVSAIGALIESDTDVPVGSHGKLRFTWREHKVEIKAQSVRTAEDRAGLRFTEDSEQLRALIAESATEVLRAQEANLEGARERNIIAGDETLTTASAGMRASGFVTWTLDEQGWKRRRSLLPDQPENGFTVAANEPEEQVELLRKTYENGDAEARRLTRLLAELSAASVVH
ncbi:MAG TPA: PilZ domain-containing protein [Thermoanaerobaculia bacterium]|nr:PilZ domain-containing protein [Thermoanaerobaculia bacterium]